MALLLCACQHGKHFSRSKYGQLQRVKTEPGYIAETGPLHIPSSTENRRENRENLLPEKEPAEQRLLDTGGEHREDRAPQQASAKEKKIEKRSDETSRPGRIRKPPQEPLSPLRGEHSRDYTKLGVASMIIGIISLVLAILMLIAFLTPFCGYAGVVLGFIGAMFSFAGGITSVILGAIALRRLNGGEGQKLGYAITGVITGSIAILLFIAAFIIFLVYLATTSSDSSSSSCNCCPANACSEATSDCCHSSTGACGDCC